MLLQDLWNFSMIASWYACIHFIITFLWLLWSSRQPLPPSHSPQEECLPPLPVSCWEPPVSEDLGQTLHSMECAWLTSGDKSIKLLFVCFFWTNIFFFQLQLFTQCYLFSCFDGKNTTLLNWFWHSQLLCCSPQSLARELLIVRFVRSSWPFEQQTDCGWPTDMIYKLSWDIQFVFAHNCLLWT